MADFAIIQTGGKQYRVKVGDVIEVELLKNISEVDFDTLMINKDEKITLGNPFVKSRVKGKVLKTKRGEKIDIRTYKAKSRHRRHIGHRQDYSVVEITSM